MTEPTVTGQRVLLRPRLVARMALRWERKVVLVVGGAGFGKSVLVAQAEAENHLAPRGVDVVVRCTEADAAPSRLLARLRRAVWPESEPDEELCAERLLAGLARRWPYGVCVMIDDAHLAAAPDRGAALLADLVGLAPAPVHFVFASRERLVGFAQLRAAGEVVDIDERDLALSADEVRRVAALHGARGGALSSLGGWPAVVTLAASFGIVGAAEYVWEAVLHHLTAEAQRVLALVAAIGGGDRRLLEAVLGPTASDPADMLAGVPLVRFNAEGGIDVHDLWQRAVGSVIADGERLGAVARAVDVLVERGDFDRAFELCARYEDWDGAGRVLVACCQRGHADVPADVAARWGAAWPSDRREEPCGLLLRGLAGRASDPLGSTTSDLLARAVSGFRASGDVAGELAASVEYVFARRNQGCPEELPRFLARAAEVAAAGHGTIVAGPLAVGRALLAGLAGDDESSAAALDAVPAESLSRDWQVVVHFSRAMAHLIVGNSDKMLDAATRCARLAPGASSHHIVAMARWCAGDPGPALRDVEEIAKDAARSKVDAVNLGAFVTTVLATAGCVEAARRHLYTLEEAVSGRPSRLTAGSVIGARATVAVAEGDEQAARTLMGDALERAPLTSPTGWRNAARWAPLAYVLLPEARRELDRLAPGAVHQARLRAARAVVWAREGDRRPDPPADSIDVGFTATSVPLRWSMTVAARLRDAGAPQAENLSRALVDLFPATSRDELRALASDGPASCRRGAASLLADVVIAPRHLIGVEILGPAVVRFDGQVHAQPQWNRERVRSLLIYLLLHAPVRREAVIDALWPDLAPEAAARNLRVTLTHLQRLLEPDRRTGEAPYFVRQTASTLTVARPPQLSVDAHVFEALIERAERADQQGIPSAALRLFHEALDLWRGPCLSDVLYEDWASATRARLTRRYVTAAVRAAEIHLAGGQPGAAETLAGRALSAEEWSEPAHRVLIAAGLARGDRAGAMRALVDCDAMLASLGARPDPHTDMLRRRLAQ